MSLKLGLYRNKHKLCCSKFCENLPSHSLSENSLKNELLDNLLQPQLSQVFLEKNEPSNKSIPQPSNDAENRQHGHTLTAIASSWDTISRYDRRYSMKIINKTSHVAKNFNNDVLDLLLSPSVLLIPPTKSKTIKTLQLSKLFLKISLSNTILKKDLYPQ